MSKTKFQWDADALIADTVEVDFSPLTTNKSEDRQPDVVIFTELPRMDLTKFVEESLALKVVQIDADGKPVTDETGKEIRKSFGEVEGEHAAFLFKWLAISCNQKKSDQTFAKMKLTVPAISALVNMLLKLNHVDEVLATSGNWLMLPSVAEFLAAANEKSPE